MPLVSFIPQMRNSEDQFTRKIVCLRSRKSSDRKPLDLFEDFSFCKNNQRNKQNPQTNQPTTTKNQETAPLLSWMTTKNQETAALLSWMIEVRNLLELTFLLIRKNKNKNLKIKVWKFCFRSHFVRPSSCINSECLYPITK